MKNEIKGGRSDMKILVVDDDLHIQRLYKEEFEEEGYEVVIASNGKEAIELFDSEVPDIVTLDILLPDVDGIRLLRQMKEKRPKVPIIMSTAYDYRDDFAVWASEAYIVKSSDLDELKATIKKMLTKE
jgi:DNA-binding response OmpR family regulator